MATLLEQIRAACTPEQIAARNDIEIAAAVNVVRPPKPVSVQIGFGMVLDTLGSDGGSVVLEKIDTLRASVPELKYVWILLEKGELDVGLKSTRDGLDKLVVSGAMTVDQAAKLKALAEVPDPVRFTEVSDVLNGVTP